MSWMDFLMIMTLTNRIQKLLKKMNHGMIVLIPNLLSLKKVKSPTKGSKTPPTPALIRSGEFQSSLGTEFPSCVKMTVKSQVTYGFWMESVVPIEDHEFEEEHDSDSTIFHNKDMTGLVVDMLKIFDKGYSRSRTRQ
ncbi:uncharacterized protein LOC111892076 isoform X1 [Lactuca sativa]|nr:uncharacterized protein LOC111892076 isoform X1 [Lactuca sativa]XP_023743910.1 uncharacterized protein LOC111892076 isoform X1 [Lactuca sativa]XP_042758201.1 uncharacterized protein LOC111892076 isoform X1 [Lactuca sativa]